MNVVEDGQTVELEHLLEQLELEVIEGNQRAIGLYHKMGFVCIGEKPNAIRLEDGSSLKELMMVKVL